MHKRRVGKRYVACGLFGALVGLFLLACFYVPIFISHHITARRLEMQQSRLTPARGEAFATYEMIAVHVQVLDDGMPSDSISVSPDGQRWYMPQDGMMSLDLAPGNYQFRAISENRTVSTEYHVRQGGENTLVLDGAKAPMSPELLILDVAEQPDGIFPLGITGAVTVTMGSAMDHARVIRRGNGFALEVNAAALNAKFYDIIVYAENGWGESVTHIGLRLPRSGEWTEIVTADDLNTIRDNLSGQYRLMNDLDLSDIHDWIPLGSTDYPFTGVFDGGGHTITGFHAPDSIAEGELFALFGTIRHAEVRGIVIREPNITPDEVSPSSQCATLIGFAVQSMVENCAVIGGKVAPPQGTASGVLASTYNCILLCLFNSADVICHAPNSELKNTGGICGASRCYGVNLANEGEVFGTHLTGGIVGFQNGGTLLRSINTGIVWGSTMVGEFPAGGIVQTNEPGSITADCYFVAEAAATGGGYIGGVRSLRPIRMEQLRDPGSLSLLGSFEGEAPDWGYASLDAAGPVPGGAFPRQVEMPLLIPTDDGFLLPEAADICYFYTLDGSDPRIHCAEGVPTVLVFLTEGQTLRVFAAQPGCRDSELYSFTVKGGMP